ncbi:MAG: fructosamine kinase family protein [Acidobacteriota bacterium]
MTPVLRQSLENRLQEALGAAARIASVRGSTLVLADGQRFFLKTQHAPPTDVFEREAEGLGALEGIGRVRGPSIVLPGASGDTRFLILEEISRGASHPSAWESFGRRLAEHHRASRGERFGFDHDNYLGRTPQPNGWSADGAEFFRRHRLAFQLDLARRNGHADDALNRLGDSLLARLDSLLDLAGEPPCLLHGDLWSGNVLSDEEGEVRWIDPAAHYAHREADLAMAKLFGGFPETFFAAYGESWPLPPGQRERKDLFQLYHLLNHLNLFGGGYREQCLEVMRRLT